jgi:hypothetical protein
VAFDEPDTVGRLNPADCVNHLLMVWAVDYIKHSPTKFSQPGKPSDVIVVDVVDLDLEDDSGQPGLVVRRAWWRPGKLIQSLRGKIGRPTPVLARMGKGSAGVGMQAPYVLVPATKDAESVKLAEAWLAAHPEFVPSESLEDVDEKAVETLSSGFGQATQAPSSPGALPPPPVPPGHMETVLERMARQAADSKKRMAAWGGGSPPQEDKPPF